jgi:hypothetical protein
MQHHNTSSGLTPIMQETWYAHAGLGPLQIGCLQWLLIISHCPGCSYLLSSITNNLH